MKRINMKKRVASMALAMLMLLSCVPNAWAVDAGTDIKAITKPTGMVIVENYDDYFGEDWKDKLGLPTAVTVTLADDSTVDAPVTWDTTGLDTREPGYYYLPGTVTLPAGATNGQNLTVSITVQVAEKTNLLTNGDFENGTASWKGKNLASVTDPTDSANKVLSIKHSPINKDDSAQSAYTNMGKETLATALNTLGVGQYALQIKAMPAAYDANTAARGDLRVRIYLRCYDASNMNSAAKNYVSDHVYMTGTTDWTNCRVIIDLDRTYAGYRTDAYCTSLTTDATDKTGALYVDDFELIPLKTALKVEPSAVKEVKTEVLARAVALNYPDYVGEDWKTALGLPASVEVLTDSNTTAELDVTWDYTGLDFTNYGKYTLVGKLDDSGFTNPDGITVKQDIYVVRAKNLLTNGDFENGITGWKGKNLASATDPTDSTNRVLSIKHEPINKDDVALSAYTNMGKETLAAALNAQGVGQYILRIKAMPAAYDENTAARDDLRLRIYLRCYDASNMNSAAKNYVSDYVYMTGTDDWMNCQVIIDLDQTYAGFRTDAYCTSVNKDQNGALYVDDFELIPLNITIPKGEEPAEIAAITSDIPVRAVIKDYDKYVGANWQAALGLPEQVEVRTANGNTALVDVTWNYEALNLSEEGKYTLVGTLDNSTYTNPLGLYTSQIIYVRDFKNLISNAGFEDGTTSWKGQNVTSATDPTDSTNKVLSIKHSPINKDDTTQSAYTNMGKEALAAAVNDLGIGQYALRIKAMPAAYDENTAAREDLRVRIYLRCYDASNMGSAAESYVSDYVYMTGTTSWTDCQTIIDLDQTYAGFRTDAYCTSVNKDLNGALYVDDFELIPLNVIIECYEGEMEQVESVIPGRQIVQNYQNYLGGSYTLEDLMLPETVDVRSTTGEIVPISVTWDISKLDLTKVGTYTVYGALEDMKLPNPNGLTVQMKVKVVAEQNIFSNPSFENDGNGWDYTSRSSIEVGIPTPVRDGDFALLFKAGRLDDVTWNYLQSFYNGNPLSVGQAITQNGGGVYMFGGWAQGTESSKDIQVQLRFLYKNMANGDAAVTKSAPAINLSTTSYSQMGGIVTLPDDIYWARMDFYLLGTPEQMRLSELYLDDFYLIPLNVEIPNMTDIIDCEEVADIYVHEGSSIKSLNLPDALQVTIKSGQKFDLSVTWDTSSFDPNKLGEQTITGELDLGKTYKNSKNFVPTVRIIVRAKGEALRQTIYISTSGSEDNDGLSPNAPKKDITKLATYLQQGYNVSLKRGDVWYLNTYCFNLKDIHATEQAPIVVGAYGSGDEKPRISFTLKIENDAWKLVDEKRNVYAADVSALGSKDGISVYRCYMNDEPLLVKERNNYVTLKEGEFCSYNNTLYIRMPEGKVPQNVDADPYSVGNRVTIKNVSYLTFENIHFKGVGAVNNMFWMDAPTKYLKFLYCDMTHVSGHIMQWETADDQIHYKPEIAYCYMDSSITEAEGSIRTGKWGCGHLEGITIRDGADGVWIHHNLIRQFSHCFIAVESLTASSDYTTTGVRNCIFEDNILEGGNAKYARAITLSGAFNLSGVQMCRNNIVRRNKCYDMTTSGHLFGENNLIYSNLFSYTHCNYTEDGELFDGKVAQPFAFDTCVYSNKNSVGNMLINNTFFNVSGAIHIDDISGSVYDNLYANNLVVNWTSDVAANGAFHDYSLLLQYVMNNGVYSTAGLADPFVVDGMIYSAEDVNNAVAGYSGNICADPKFVNADLSQMQHGARLDFTLSNESPMRYAGLSLYASVYEIFPMWEKLMEDYTDINGTLYLAESPSIGAWSFCEKIKGEVAEVGKLDDILCRPGATFDQLNLPDAVLATNDQGIDVMLLATWSDANFDSSKPGTVTLTAELRNGPHTELTINGKVATINVNIKDKLELLNVSTILSDITVLYGTSLEDVLKKLPAELEVMEESGFQERLPVTWSCENYNPTKPDAYTFKCILPDHMITNAREFSIEVEVRVLHEIGRGMELLVNPDFIDGTSPDPWKTGWGTGSFKVTTDPELVYPGEPSAAIITMSGRYGSLQQNVLGQLQLMGNGKYLFRMYMRAYDPARPIDSSVACLKVFTPNTYTLLTRTKTNIGTDWVEYIAVMDVTDVEKATEIIFHTSTYKSEEDVEDPPKSYVISGCSLIYLGVTDEEVEATMDSIDLDWNAIKGENGYDMDNVTSDLTLPGTIGTASKITWTSSNESAITSDGKVTMGRLPQTVTLTATITYGNIETVKKFTVTVPRDPSLPSYSASLSGDQTVKIGDEFQVVISVNSENATVYNAYRFTLSFSTDKLEYVGISDPTATVVVEDGKIVISGIGTEKSITQTVTVTFKALKSGVTDVKLVKVEMDNDPNASLDALPTMVVANRDATITIEKDSAGKDANTDTDTDPESGNGALIYILVGVVVAILACGGVIAWILIKKKKQSATEEPTENDTTETEE